MPRFTSFLLAAGAGVLAITGCNGNPQQDPPQLCGVFSLHRGDPWVSHGVDLIVLNPDHTFEHFYSRGSTGKDLSQSGHWQTSPGKITFDPFIGWDLFGPTPKGIASPEPATTTLPLRLEGNYQIDVNLDRGQTFYQVDECKD